MKTLLKLVKNNKIFYCVICLVSIIILLWSLSRNNLVEKFSSIFDDIYINKEWGPGKIQGGSSGPGSNVIANKKYINYLNDFIKEKNIKSIVDIGCGDWQIMKNINLNNIKYYGYDASKNVINNNNNKFKKENIKFIYSDLDLKTNYPKADLLICKDVLQHLSYKNINKIISQFNKFKYLFIIDDKNDSGNTINKDIKDGGYRKIDIRNPPFNIKNLSEPIQLWKAKEKSLLKR